jgi:hypothetical protein
MADGLRIPASYVASGWGIPKVCVRHGEPATAHKGVRFISRIPGWAYLLLLAGALPFVIVAYAVRKEVRAQAWPFCMRCAHDRKNRLWIGITLMVVAVAGIPLAAAFEAGSLSVFLLIVLIFAGFVVTLRGGWSFVAGGIVVTKGMEVEFRKAHGAFAAEAVAAQQAAAQYYATSQQQPAQYYAMPQQQPAQYYATPQQYYPAPQQAPVPGLPALPVIPPMDDPKP